METEARNFSYQVSLETVDATAGADTTRRTLASFKTATANLTFTPQNDGVALIAQCVEGQVGTLTFYEAGSVTGRPSTTMPALCMGISRTVPFNDVVTYDISWQANAAVTYGTV
jgi:hypothetical protein